MKNFKELREGLGPKALIRKEKELNLKLKELKVRAAERAEKESEVKEGTWEIPKNQNELALLADMLMKPFPATKPRDLDKFLDKFPVGDDSLYDEIDSQMYEKNPDGSIKRPLKKMNSFKKVFLNVIAGEALAKEKWIKGKTQGNKYKVTHHFFGPMDPVDLDLDQQESDEGLPSRPKAKRRPGNYRKKPMQKYEV